MRSLLTVLGIFIGVASVIWLLAIGEGISQRGPAADRGAGGRQHHRPLDQAAGRRDGQFGRAGSLRPDARRLRNAGADDPDDQAGPADSRGPPHVHLRRPQRGRPAGRLHAGILRRDAAGARPRAAADRCRRGRAAQLLRAVQRHRRAAVSLSRPARPPRLPIGKQGLLRGDRRARSIARPRPRSAARWRPRISTPTFTFRSHDAAADRRLRLYPPRQLTHVPKSSS